jgi:hypothetical protein
VVDEATHQLIDYPSEFAPFWHLVVTHSLIHLKEFLAHLALMPFPLGAAMKN